MFLFHENSIVLQIIKSEIEFAFDFRFQSDRTAWFKLFVCVNCKQWSITPCLDVWLRGQRNGNCAAPCSMTFKHIKVNGCIDGFRGFRSTSSAVQRFTTASLRSCENRINYATHAALLRFVVIIYYYYCCCCLLIRCENAPSNLSTVGVVFACVRPTSSPFSFNFDGIRWEYGKTKPYYVRTSGSFSRKRKRNNKRRNELLNIAFAVTAQAKCCGFCNIVLETQSVRECKSPLGMCLLTIVAYFRSFNQTDSYTYTRTHSSDFQCSIYTYITGRSHEFCCFWASSGQRVEEAEQSVIHAIIHFTWCRRSSVVADVIGTQLHFKLQFIDHNLWNIPVTCRFRFHFGLFHSSRLHLHIVFTFAYFMYLLWLCNGWSKTKINAFCTGN